MAKLMYGTIRSNGLRIQYYRTGDEKPVLIFLHGALDNAMCWNNIPVYLEPEYDVVLMDARGHGISSASETGYSPEAQAEDVGAIIRELRLYKPVLIGHSVGADTAAVTAVKFPGLVKGVILEDPPWPYDYFGTTDEERRAKAAEMIAQIDAYKAMSFDELVSHAKGKYPSWEESEFFQWAKARRLVSPKVALNITEPRGDWKTMVSQIKCPGLLITGDTSLGAIITPEITDEISRLWKKVTVVNIPNAGHHIRREQYRLYREAVKTYLRKLKREK